MLRVFKASGEVALAIPFTEFVDMAPMNEHPVRVQAIKRHLQRLIGQPRFKQRLVLADGQMLLDDAVLERPMDVQLVLQAFEGSSQDKSGNWGRLPSTTISLRWSNFCRGRKIRT